jgi:hypothetical protein
MAWVEKRGYIFTLVVTPLAFQPVIEPTHHQKKRKEIKTYAKGGGFSFI